MNNKFFYLYLIAGTLALLLLIYQLVAFAGRLHYAAVAADVVLVVLFYYLALKVYREKTDSDLM